MRQAKGIERELKKLLKSTTLPSIFVQFSFGYFEYCKAFYLSSAVRKSTRSFDFLD